MSVVVDIVFPSFQKVTESPDSPLLFVSYHHSHLRETLGHEYFPAIAYLSDSQSTLVLQVSTPLLPFH
jgi:hypothetical protein